MAPKRKTLVLLDGNALIHRSYHALPPMTTKTGESVHAVYGFAMTLFSVLEKFKPDYIAASFDLLGGTFRDELYAEYKATRSAAPDDLYAQIPRVKELVTSMNIPIYELAGFEADDCVGTLAAQGEREGLDVIIVTGDTDTLQLVTEHVKVFALRKGLKDLVLYGIPEVTEKYGFPPERLVDYKGLRGDSSDNIPGVKGIGEKGATDLIQEFGSLEDIYGSLEKVKPKLREKLEADRDMAFLSKKLGTIDTTAPVTLDSAAALTHDFDRATVEALLRGLEFYSLLKRLPGGTTNDASTGTEASEKKVKTKKTKQITTKKELEDFLNTMEPIAVVVQEKEASLFGGGIEALGLATRARAVEVLWNESTTLTLAHFLSDAARAKIVHDWKGEWHRLDMAGMHFSGVALDVLLAAYMVNPGSKVDRDTLSESYTGRAWSAWLLSEKAASLFVMQDKIEVEIQRIVTEQTPEKNIQKILLDLEQALVPVIFEMEKTGILLKPSVFTKLSTEIDAALKKDEQAIYHLAGREFNIGSPKQLAEVLFVDLAIPTEGVKKNKTGFSTASPELEKLRDTYPIVKLIENYRELSKLKNTYVDVLPGMVYSDGRLHTTFHQAVAATGRLSSMDPNLQNIPIRTEWGNRMRTGFIAGPGKKFVGADYSQIELRIAAHLSEDAVMKSAFANGEDIHTTTAALVHGIEGEAVTAEMRREAKVLNFGIIYGMGAFGLAQAAGIDQKAASLFIKNYLKKFAGVAAYMEAMKKMAHEKGYVETELGRRRYLPEIASGNTGLVRAAERMAINMPIQGLEADIVKLAMLAADKMVKEKFPGQAQLLLQVHDELIFEVDEKIAEAFAEALKPVMRNVYPLSVPLDISVAVGDTWEEI